MAVQGQTNKSVTKHPDTMAQPSTTQISFRMMGGIGRAVRCRVSSAAIRISG